MFTPHATSQTTRRADVPARDDAAVRGSSSPSFLYTREQRARRDASAWTLVQGILAPIQFAVFLISFCLVVRTLLTGDGAMAATLSVVAKTMMLYAIMLTGSIWEKVVFGRYLFAPAFFWEDVVGIVVILLHTLYIAALVTDALDLRAQLVLALAAYATYVFNAAQFILKLRAARRQAVPAGLASLA